MAAQPTRTPDPLVALLLALLFPRTLRALRKAAARSLPPPVAADAPALRSACTPETATPGAATPGVALPCNQSETEDMNTVAQAAVLPLPPPRAPFVAAPGSARHTALLRWHRARLLVETAQQHPRFPVIAGSAGGDGEA
jgi:hypothetical protein